MGDKENAGGEVMTRNATRLWSAGQRGIRFIPRLCLYLLLFGLSFVFLYPFLYMISKSLMTNEDLNNFMVVWLPRSLHFQNYATAAKLMNFTRGLGNSLFVTLVATLGQLISCSMAGYGLARFRFPGRTACFFVVILAMIIPTQTIVVPLYLLYAELGWLNTFLPLIVPAYLGYGLKGALFIFVFRQFYSGPPKELEEASQIDGCGFLRTYAYIVFPVARSAYVVVLVLALVWHWSDYFEPSMFCSKADLQLLSAGLNNISNALTLAADTLETMYDINDNNTLNNAVVMAGTFMTVSPLIVMFAFLQKKFIQGMERTGLTGE